MDKQFNFLSVRSLLLWMSALSFSQVQGQELKVKVDLTDVPKECRTFSGTIKFYNSTEDAVPVSRSIKLDNYNETEKEFALADLGLENVKNATTVSLSSKQFVNAVRCISSSKSLSERVTFDFSNEKAIYLPEVTNMEGKPMKGSLIFLNLNKGYNVENSLPLDKGQWILLGDKTADYDYLIQPGEEGYVPVLGKFSAKESKIETDYRNGRVIRYGVKDRDGSPCLIQQWGGGYFFFTYRGMNEKEHQGTCQFNLRIKPFGQYVSSDGLYNQCEFHALPGRQHVWFFPKNLVPANNKNYAFSAYEQTEGNRIVGQSFFTIKTGTTPQDVWMDFSQFNELTVRVNSSKKASGTESDWVLRLALNNPKGNYQTFEDDERMFGDKFIFVKDSIDSKVSRILIPQNFTNVEVIPYYFSQWVTKFSETIPKAQPQTVKLKNDKEVVIDFSDYCKVVFRVTENFFDEGYLLIDGREVRGYNPNTEEYKRYFNDHEHTYKSTWMDVYLPTGKHTWSAVKDNGEVVVEETPFTVEKTTDIRIEMDGIK